MLHIWYVRFSNQFCADSALAIIVASLFLTTGWALRGFPNAFRWLIHLFGYRESVRHPPHEEKNKVGINRKRGQGRTSSTPQPNTSALSHWHSTWPIVRGWSYSTWRRFLHPLHQECSQRALWHYRKWCKQFRLLESRKSWWAWSQHLHHVRLGWQWSHLLFCIRLWSYTDFFEYRVNVRSKWSAY